MPLSLAINVSKGYAMQFKVSFKGLHRFTGTLGFATRYIESTWGSLREAYEMGVKLEPLTRLPQ